MMSTVSRKYIFIIDDSVDNQTLLTMLFETKGYKVECASNGKSALSILEELAVLPDLILLDAQMPVMDGYEFRAQQSRNERLAKIPVVVMTADSGDEVDDKMGHPEGLLTKPLEIKSILASVLPLL